MERIIVILVTLLFSNSVLAYYYGSITINNVQYAPDYAVAENDHSVGGALNLTKDEIVGLNGAIKNVHVEYSLPIYKDINVDLIRSLNRLSDTYTPIKSIGNWHLETPILVMNSVDDLSNACQNPTNVGTTIVTIPDYDADIAWSSGNYWSSAYSEKIRGNTRVERRPYLGISFVMPGENPRQLLKNTNTNFNSVYVTTDNWKGDCLPNGGFLITSPSGVKYSFDKVSINTTEKLKTVPTDIVASCTYSTIPRDAKLDLIEQTGNSDPSIDGCKISVYNSRVAVSEVTTTIPADLSRNYVHMIYYQVSKIENRYGENIMYYYRNASNGVHELLYVDLYPSGIVPAGYSQEDRYISLGYSGDSLQIIYHPASSRNYDWTQSLDIEYKYVDGMLSEAYGMSSTEPWRYFYNYYGLTKQLVKIVNPNYGIIEYIRTANGFKRRTLKDYDPTCGGTPNCDPFGKSTLIGEWSLTTSHTSDFKYQDLLISGPKGETTSVRSVMAISNNKNDFRYGLPLTLETKDNTGQPVKKTTYTWISLPAYGSSGIAEKYPAQENPVVISNLTIMQDGQEYVTEYLNHDSLGFPQEINESGNINVLTKLRNTRRRLITYEYNKTYNITGLVKTVAIDINGTLPASFKYITDYDLFRNYDGYGNLYREYNGSGAYNEYSYKKGYLYTISHNGYVEKRFGFYNRGIPRDETIYNELGNMQITRYTDNLGRVTNIYENGAATQYKYRYRQSNPWKIYYPEGGYEVFSIDSRGTYYSSYSNSDPNPHRFRYVSNDGFGRNTFSYSNEKSAPNYTSIVNEFDAYNNVTFEGKPYTDATIVGSHSGGVDTTYDILKRVVTKGIRGKNHSRTIYYSDKTEVYDENNQLTTYYHNSYGSPNEKYITKVVNPDAINEVNGQTISTSFSIDRDKVGRIKNVVEDNTNIYRKYEYDSSRRVQYVRMPDVLQDKQIIYDSSDRIWRIKSLETGDQKWFDYDYYSGRIKSVSNAPSYLNPSIITSYSYYPTNLLQNVTTMQTMDSYTYDLDKNLRSETIATTNYPTLTFSYTYGELSRLSTMTYPSGEVIDYGPDPWGWETQALPFITKVGYDLGRLSSLEFANGNTFSQKYEDANYSLPTYRAFTSNNKITEENLLYDNMSNLTNYTVQGDDWTYRYDSRSQLVSESSQRGVQRSIGYDELGNISDINETTTGSTNLSSFSHDGAKLTQSIKNNQTTNIVSDRNGNILNNYNAKSGTGNEFIFNIFDQLVSSTKKDSNGVEVASSEYVYDGNNRLRVATETNSSGQTLRRMIVYGRNGNKLVEFSPDEMGGTYVEYYYIRNKLVASKRFTNISTTDSDGDGISDLDELLNGTPFGI